MATSRPIEPSYYIFFDKNIIYFTSKSTEKFHMFDFQVFFKVVNP